MLTILRNPLDRLLSLYYFDRFKKNRDHHPIECDLPEWLSTPEAKSAAITFVRMFVGDTMASQQLVSADGNSQVMDAAVANAIANLRSFAIVGVLENLQGFENAVQQRYGVRSAIGHHNRNPSSGYPKFNEQPKELQNRIRELCQPDVKIYETFTRAR
jgi:malonyl CoA-acyl carrier protein transacylase